LILISELTILDNANNDISMNIGNHDKNNNTATNDNDSPEVTFALFPQLSSLLWKDDRIIVDSLLYQVDCGDLQTPVY
jgi:hypothetical protein